MGYKDLYKNGDVINGIKLVSDIWVEKEQSKATFLCSCGNEFTTRVRDIAGGRTKSCGCLQKIVASIPKNNYQKGDVIGVLKFLNRVESKPGEPSANFLCDCGNEFITKIESVKSLSTKSCGCKTSQFIIEAQTIHEPVQYIKEGIKKIPDLRKIDIDRFWLKVGITAQQNLCWNWQATGDRYGGFRVGKGMYKSNRVAYKLHYGVDPADKEVMHSCDNPKCCNPSHLSLGTHKENMQDMVVKGRSNAAGHKNKIHSQQTVNQ